jgi:hypothetical protein
MFFNSYLEKRMVEADFDKFKISEKNMVVSELANRSGLLLSEITPEYVLNHNKKLKIEVLKEQCENAILEGFVASNGHTYRTNRDDQINMIGQKDELMADESTETVYWKTEDAGYIAHSREEWLMIYNEAFAHKRQSLFKYDSLKQAVLDAKTHADVVAINWETEL